MAQEKKRKGKSRKGTPSARDVKVNLAPTVEFLHKHVSEALCNEVYQDLRRTERERKWSLFALARFWLAVLFYAPTSLTQLLEQVRDGEITGFLPQVAASAEAFFQKCKGFSSDFFQALYARFIGEIEAKAPEQYCRDLAYLRKHFTGVYAIDGSRLDKIAHRLKILHNEKAAVLPGCLLAVYDIFRGIATQLWFQADAAAAEFTRALLPIECLGPNSLLIGDRLYCSTALFGLLRDTGVFGVFRRNKTVSVKKVRRLNRQRTENGLLDDWLVKAGQEGIELRLIVFKSKGKSYQALTSVLDPSRLSAEDVAKLYPKRWSIERLFYDLKSVLDLKKLYAANPNAVAMQVFATAMVHAAFRIAQGDIARKHDVPPESLSPEKLFPLLALVSIKILEAELVFEATQAANPHVKLRKPDWKTLPGTTVSLRHLLKQRRSDKRRPREYDKERAKWKSITKVDGADELT